MADPDAQVIARLRDLLGERGVREQPDDYLPDIVLKPESTEQVSAVLELCNAAGQALVPLGGKTGLASGHFQTNGEIGLSLERMNAIEEIDSDNRTMTVQSGCILQVAAEAAAERELLLPMDWGARGSATVGGGVSTNAGGNMVIRYGMARDSVLGLEVVLADGTVVTSLNKMLKNNTGYDLKQWFIGAEGTLGVVTRVVLRLRPLPTSQNTALLAVQDFPRVAELLRFLDARSGGSLSAFEVMWPDFYEYITREGYVHPRPLPHGYGHYVLVETQGSEPVHDAERFEAVLGEAMEQGLVEDAVLSRSQAERNELWEIRDDVLDFFNLGPFIPFDVSVTIERMEAFIADIRAQMAQYDGAICVVFGHLGDNNLHLNLGNRDAQKFDYEAMQTLLYETVEKYAGSISAEHGIGLSKREQLPRSRSAEELQLMMRLKRMLDPHNILNPNKIFSAEQIAAA
ncbi:MAG: FAD-binding oxidoreductase [Halioglobus sp.]|nr:FAD-binding oxidoreductase [Halioglobus sp.]|tara:strand:- start:1693 stop:3066 length:1374 start_codon:yes stop_codon:yes gene_type:complete